MSTLATPALPATPVHGLPIGRLLQLIRRNLLLITVLGFAGAIAAYAYARTLPKTYTASSLIAVEGDRFAIPELQGALRGDSAPDPMPIVRTEMQALTSRQLVQAVVDKLDLIKVAEFNAGLRPPTLVTQIKYAFQSLLPASSDVPQENNPNEGVLNAVTHGIKIFQDNRSLVIEVGFTSLDPNRSSEIVNTLITEYIAERAGRRVNANQGANQAMNERIDQVRDDVAAIEQKMRDLRNTNDLVLLRAGSVGQQQLEELTTAAARAGVDRAQLETTFDRATTLAQHGASDALTSVLNSPTISALRAQEAAASQRVAELTTHYGAGYPAVRSAQAELDATRRQMGGETGRIVASLGTQLRVARQQETDIKAQLEEARKTALTGENARAQLEQLQQEVTSRRALYQTLLERAQQTVNQPVSAQTPDVRVVSTAAPPSSPSGPNTKIAAAFGGVAGGLLGGLLALARLRRVDTFADPAAATPPPGWTVVATLPRTYFRARSTLAAKVVADPGSPEAQAMRDLRDAARRMGRASSPRTLMVSAATVPEDGLQLALALARVAARDGERVLLIDVNFGKPGLARALDLRAGDEAPGDVRLVLGLAGPARDWLDVVTLDPHSPLEVLAPAGAGGEAPGVLSGNAFQNLIVETRAAFDLLVLSGPAAGSPDAAVIAQRSDATLLVTDSAAQRAPAQAAAARLEQASRHPVGCVMIGP